MKTRPSTIVDVLKLSAEEQKNSIAFTFLVDGETPSSSVTYGQLDQQARVIACHLQLLFKRGDRVLLMYPSGLEFVSVFLGCLYAGMVAVPAYPPRGNKNLTRLLSVIEDVDASVILSTSAIADRVKTYLPAALECLSTDLIKGDTVSDSLTRSPDEHELAFVQYTSGSTGKPKGVMVSHGNLMHNQQSICQAFQTSPQSVYVSWLPLFHDMGLIGGMLHTIYHGSSMVLMPSAAFIQKPVRWLQAISKYNGTFSGAPDFAYELCVSSITDEQKASLDLSRWTIACNGAEPVRVQTLDRFAEAFKRCGFRREHFYPCYGMAETTLIVAGAKKLPTPSILVVDKNALEKGRVVLATLPENNAHRLVSSGRVCHGMRAVIVDPITGISCPPGQVGEIRVSGDSVAGGYWNRPDTTVEIFQTRLADKSDGPFLRTGDIGFLYEDELYVTGRCKDLMIFRGRNCYPQDIEYIVSDSHPALVPGGCAAFSIEADNEERLVIVQEVGRRFIRSLNTNEVIHAIRRTVAEQSDLPVYAVTLIRAGQSKKTSSGKIQRQATRSAYLNDELTSIARWCLGDELPEPGNGETRAQSSAGLATGRSVEEIQEWLLGHIADRLKVNLSRISIYDDFAQYGMDSMSAMTLSGELETWLGRKLSPTLAYDYPTIHTLAHYLAGQRVNQNCPVNTPLIPEQATQPEPIAVVGLSCRFPGAPNAQSFWQLLKNGGDAIDTVPSDRWQNSAFYDARAGILGKMNSRWGGFIPGVDQFDSEFFGIAPREAEAMDPQQRLLLEVAWEALENAGQAPDQLGQSKTGVFVGISSQDYAQLQVSNPLNGGRYFGTGSALSIAANRLSYFFDFHGPSLAVDTACSSSLVALHQACQSLRTGECSMALSGGVNVMLSPMLSIVFSQAQMLASDGRCKTFDESADGYVRGEGCGVVVLKRLSDARRDGDTILATIKGSAMNSDGRTNGLTAPNGGSQQAVIREALHNAGVTAHQIQYVEAHGTGTALGDPIEFNALKAVLSEGRTSTQPCLVGSVKTNIGHLEAAAGIAGFIKLVLSLHHREIPPNLHFSTLNPHIPADMEPFSIPVSAQPWPEGEGRRLGGISAFGFGGTNVHLIAEAAPPLPASSQEDEPKASLLTLSARSATAARVLAARYVQYLSEQPEVNLSDVCHTANTGRAHLCYRVAVLVDSVATTMRRLQAFESGVETEGVRHGECQPNLSPDRILAQQQTPQCLADHYVRGATIDWREYYRGSRRLALALPTYPFQRQRYWFTSEQSPVTAEPADQNALPSSLTGMLYQINWLVSQIQRDANDLTVDLSELESSLTKQCDELIATPAVAHYADALAQVEVRSSTYVLLALQQMGVEFHIGQTLSTAAMQQTLGIDIRYQSLLKRLLLMLSEDGILRPEADHWRVIETPVPPQETLSALSAAPAEQTLLERCGTRLASVLQGQCDPVSLLFPNGNVEVLAALYQDSPGARVFNRLIQDSLAQAMDKLPSDRRLRILEIGAGTGGTTSQLLPILSKRDVDYVFTDISPAFLHAAESQFSDFPFVRYQTLNIEQSPVEQGFEEDGFDIVVAANVLHATESLTHTLTHVRRLLSPSGLLLLFEGTAPQRWLDLSFGLTEGWWRFNDHALRPDYPLVSVSQWKSLLGDTGFQQTVAVSPDAQRYPALARQAVIVARADQTSADSRQTGWLVFAERSELAQVLVERLEASNETYQVVPSVGDCSTLERCLTDYQHQTKAVSQHRIVYIPDTDQPDTELLSTDALTQRSQNSSRDLLHLCQVLSRHILCAPASLQVVTQNAQAIGTEPALNGIAHAVLWGMGKVINLEFPALRCRFMDVDGATDGVADWLYKELRAEPVEPQLIFRNGQRYVSRLVAQPSLSPSTIEMTSDASSSYLITGGFGDLGLATARQLIKRGARTLILIGRRAASPSALNQMNELVALGATVKTFQADVADSARMAVVLAEIDQTLPPLRGVIHAAGTLDDGLLQHLTAEQFANTFAAKVSGAWTLHRLTRETPLDFFILYSSAASLLGSPGQATHAAANAFLDALAHHRQRLGLPGLSINWGVWATLGAAARQGAQTLMQQRGIEAIEPEYGLAAFDYLLSISDASVGVVPIAWERFLKQLPETPFFDLIDPAAKEPNLQELPVQSADFLKALRRATPAAQKTQLTDYLTDAVAEAMRMAPSEVNRHTAIANMGLDSLMALDLTNKLKTELHVDVSMVHIMDGISVTDLAETLQDSLNEHNTESTASTVIDTTSSVQETGLDIDEMVSQMSDDDVDQLLKRMLNGNKE